MSYQNNDLQRMCQHVNQAIREIERQTEPVRQVIQHIATQVEPLYKQYVEFCNLADHKFEQALHQVQINVEERNRRRHTMPETRNFGYDEREEGG